MTEIKSSVNGLNKRMEGTEERTNELEYRKVEITQYEQKRENRLKKMNRSSGTYETITKDLTFM